MEPIKISVDVTVDLSESAKAFVTALFAKSSTPASEAPAAAAKPAVLAKPTPGASTAPAKPAALAKPATSAPTPTITIEDVRKALSEKVNAHRSEIKDKLNALGAPSVTKLDQSKYHEMYDFLIALD